jgi:hypothetical protein
MLLLILGALVLTRHLLWEDRSEPPPHENPSKVRPVPPVLPRIFEPKAPEKESSKAIPVLEPSGPLMEVPPPLKTTAPVQDKVRVLPPIQAEPDEEEVVESPFEFEPEPIVEEPPEDVAPPPPIPPEPGPDFVR